MNDNPKYTKFIPLFVEQWLRVLPSCHITIIYIGESVPNTVPEKYNAYIRCFKPIAGIHTAYIAQVIRILYPSLLDPDDVIMITDMDMIPGKGTYFTSDAIHSVSDNAFVSFRPLSVVPANQIAMCYVAAKGSTWRSVFSINTERDIERFLTEHYYRAYDGVHGGNGWYSDQSLLYQYVMAWNGLFVELNDSQTGFRRLDYYHHHYDKSRFVSLLDNPVYSDCHLYSHMCNWSDEDILEIIHMLK